MKKHIVLSAGFLLLSHLLYSQTWNPPINVIGPYSGTGGRFGEFPKLLLVNGNPAIAAYDATRGNLIFIRAVNTNGTSWASPVVVDFAGNTGLWISMQIVNGNPAICYYDGTNLDLKYSRAIDANGIAWSAPITIDATGNVGQYTSLQIVNNNPAIAYYDYTNQDLKYVRASDINGNSWGSPVTIDFTGDVGQWASLAIVGGNPAISYQNATGNGSGNGSLKFVRATDASGTTWGTPVTAANAINTSRPGTYTSLKMVNGNPAISYNDGGLKYVRATDVNGASWASPITIDAAVNTGECTSLEIVNGNPAISYYDFTNGYLKYVRATDISGTAWSSPVSADISASYGYYTALQIINNNPAIAYFGIGDYFNLKFVRSTDINGTAWGVPVSFSITGNIGGWSSLQVINGNPAISFYNATASPYGHLQYVRATDAAGTAWGTPITADITFGDVGKYSCLHMVNGNPAISYFINGSLKYVRSTDALGAAWGTPVTLESVGLSTWEVYNSLEIVNGNPAVSYYSASGSLKFIRSTDANGTAWSSPVTLDATGLVGLYPTLLIVNNNPAISYYDKLGTKLKYIRATDVNGTTWGTPVTVDDPSPGSAGFYTSMQIVNGNPAISYSNGSALELKYVRATDANGTAWASPVIIDVSAFVGYHTSMQTVNNNPAISYYDETNHDLKYVHANDASGTTWATPVILDSAGDVGSFNSMQVVNGNAAISYYDASTGLLKYISAGNATAVNDVNSLSKFIKIFPNPVTDKLTVINTNSSHLTNIRLFDLLGKEVLPSKQFTDQTEVNMKSLGVGIYIIMVYDKKTSSFTSRIIVKH